MKKLEHLTINISGINFISKNKNLALSNMDATEIQDNPKTKETPYTFSKIQHFFSNSKPFWIPIKWLRGHSLSKLQMVYSKITCVDTFYEKM